MPKKSVAQRLVEFGGWLVSHVPPFLIGPLALKSYSECQGLEAGFDAYMATAFDLWDFDEDEVFHFQSQFVFPAA
jgi:hypothetical protein